MNDNSYYGMLMNGNMGIGNNAANFQSGGITGANTSGVNYGNFGQSSSNSLWDSFNKGMGNSFDTDFMGTMGGAANIATGLYGMYQGNKMMGMYEDNLDMAKEQWGEKKAELAHLRDTRKRITNSY